MVGRAVDDVFPIWSRILQEGDRGEFVDDELGRGRPRIAVLAHQIKMLVLKADGLLRIFFDPLRKEDDSVQQTFW